MSGRWVDSRIMGVVPFPLLVAATALVLIDPDPDTRRPVVGTVLLACVAGGWLAIMAVRHPAWKGSGALRLVYFVGVLVIAAALLMWSPWFALCTGVVAPQAFALFSSRGAFAGIAVACLLPAAITSERSASGWPEPSYPLVLSLVVPLLVAGLVVGRENDQRRALLAERDALQNQLVRQARAAGVAQERDRMARELHDTLAQNLTAVVAQLEAAQHAIDSTGPGRRYVVRAAELARAGLEEARRSVWERRPRALENASLDDAIRRLAPGVDGCGSRVDGPRVRAEITGEKRSLTPAAEHALLRVAQEAVANAVRHADAASVDVRLSYLPDVVLLEVRDDGRGFVGRTPSGSADDTRFGLATMRERMSALGGVLLVTSTAGGGTTITARLPTPARERIGP